MKKTNTKIIRWGIFSGIVYSIGVALYAIVNENSLPETAFNIPRWFDGIVIILCTMVYIKLNDKDIDPPFQQLIYLLIMVLIVVNIGLIGFILTFSIMALIVLISTLKIFDFPYITRKIKLLCSYLNAEKK